MHEPESPPPDAAGPMVPGSVVILVVVGLSLAAATFSWFYYRQLQERPLALWGSEAASLILNAPQARMYRLASIGDDAPERSTRRVEIPTETAAKLPQLTIGGERYAVLADQDISHAPGFSHVRQGLIHDRSFAWDERPAVSPEWDYAIEFSHHGDNAIVAFDFENDCATRVGGERTISIRPVAEAIHDFLIEQLPVPDVEVPPPPAP